MPPARTNARRPCQPPLRPRAPAPQPAHSLHSLFSCPLQVASLTAEVARLNGQQVTLDDAPRAAGGEVVDAAAVISQHLVSFTSLQELVAQNTQLRCGPGGLGAGRLPARARSGPRLRLGALGPPPRLRCCRRALPHPPTRPCPPAPGRTIARELAEELEASRAAAGGRAAAAAAGASPEERAAQAAQIAALQARLSEATAAVEHYRQVLEQRLKAGASPAQAGQAEVGRAAWPVGPAPSHSLIQCAACCASTPCCAS